MEVVDEPEHSYQPPPPYAPPSGRTAPLNELQMLGRTTYPQQYPYSAPLPAYPTPNPYPPVAWHPANQWPAGGEWQTARHVRAASRRRSRLVAGAVVATLFVIVGTLLIGQSRASRRSLSVPDSAAGYSRISSVTSGQLQSMFGSTGTLGGLSPEDLQHAKVGVYGHNSATLPSMVFVGFDAASPTISRQLGSEDSAQVTSDVLASAGSTLTPVEVDAGPLGGSIKCGTVEMDGVEASVGVWADADTLGIVLLFDPTLSPSRQQTGDVTRSFRNAAES